MKCMFYNCSSLNSLDLISFNTSNVTDMESMFDGCSSLANLDLSSFNTNKVTNMIEMFNSCSSLTNVDLSSFNANNADTKKMFNGCKKELSYNSSDKKIVNAFKNI